LFSHLFRFSPAAKPPLKIGLLIDGTTLIRSFADVLEDIGRSNFAVIDCAIVQRHSSVGISRKRNRLHALYSRFANKKVRDQLLYDLYMRWDTARFGRGEYALAEVDCTAQLHDVPTIEVEPITTGFVHRFPPSVVEAIRQRELDVLLRFGFNILRGDILNASHYGIWSFHHGDNEFYRGGPALFWEMWENNPLSGVILQRLTDELDGGTVLCKSIFATSATISLAENRQGPYSATTHFVIRKLHELHRFGYSELEARRIPDAPYRGRRRLYKTPTNSDMLRWYGRRIRARVRRIGQPAMVKQWRVGVRKGGPFLDEASVRGDSLDPSGFNWLDSPDRGYYADPFLIRHGGMLWLFTEKFESSQGKGIIAVTQLDESGRPLGFVPCLDLPHHLSFPFVFKHGNELWLIPEAADAHAVTLYRARQFPFDWVAEHVLLIGDYVDTVVWEDDSWWMLTTVREPPGHCVHTLLLRAETLTGEWSLHPASPLFNDVRLARNAGAVFELSGRRFRVSQDCSVEYGRSFQINEITTMTDKHYGERAIAGLQPHFLPNLIGTHTYNRSEDIEVIDGCFLEPDRR
jgi:hypothetical protein